MTDADLAPTPLRFPPKPGVIRLPLSFAALASFDTIIDTRSPAEWELDHLPNAVSFPVLDDIERIQIGTLYKQISSFEAKRVGAALVAKNIATHLETAFHDKPKSWRPLIYCWRGGARSGAMTHVLRQVGWDAVQLEGGYKQWRTQLVRDLEELPVAFSFVAICGRTGSGKSRLLEAIAQAGGQVLDLEQLAAHKGSVLGQLPDKPQPSQKWFENTLWQQLSMFDPARPVFVEAESKKIGLLRVPEALLASMWTGHCVELITPPPLRIALLIDEYAHLIHDSELLLSKLDCLRGLHSNEQIAHWHQLIALGDWQALVSDLLSNHYDPAYDRSMFKNYVHAADARPVHLADVSEDGFGAAAQVILTSHAKLGLPRHRGLGQLP